MLTSPGNIFIGEWRFIRPAHTEHLQQKVTPRRLPQSCVHFSIVDLELICSEGQGGKNVSCFRESEGSRQQAGI